MRNHIAFLAAALSLTACGARQERTASLEPRSTSSIRLYGRELPDCPYRELGTVTGQRVRDLQRAAFSLRANAVLVEPSEGVTLGVGPYSGVAIQFLSADCRH